MLFLSTALLLTPAALADIPPGDTAGEDPGGEEGQEGESPDTAIDEEDDDGCATVAASASLLGVGAAALMVGWRREG